MQNDLPMATRDAIESMEIKFPGPKGEDPRGKCGESSLDPSIFPNDLLNRIEALEIKFRTLQTRCNSVLAMQAQIDSILNELKIRIRGGGMEEFKNGRKHAKR